MSENSPKCNNFVCSDSYRTTYIFLSVMILIFAFAFFVWGIWIREVAFVICSAIMIALCALANVYTLPIFSKYYIEKQKVVLKVGAIYIKQISLEHSKTRITKLDSRDGWKHLISRDEYIIIAAHDIDIDLVLHYTDKDLLKVLKTKGVIAIPANAMQALYNRNTI